MRQRRFFKTASLMRAGHAIIVPVLAVRVASKGRGRGNWEVTMHVARRPYASFMLSVFLPKGREWKDKLSLLSIRF